MKQSLTDILNGAHGIHAVSFYNSSLQTDDTSQIAFVSVSRQQYLSSGYLKKPKLRDGSSGQQIIMYAGGDKLFDERYFQDDVEVIKRRFIRDAKDLDVLLGHLQDIEVIEDSRALLAFKDQPILPIITTTTSPYISMVNQFIDRVTYDALYSNHSHVIKACISELQRIFTKEMEIIASLPTHMVLIDEYYEGELNPKFLKRDIAFIKEATVNIDNVGISLPASQTQLFCGFGFYHVATLDQMSREHVNIVKAPPYEGELESLLNELRGKYPDYSILLIV